MGRADSVTAAGAKAQCARQLRLQRGKSCLDVIARESPPLEVGPDRKVAVPARSELLGASPGDPPVVLEAGTGHSSERRASALPAAPSAAKRRRSRATAAARWRLSSTPGARPARSTTSAGNVRQLSPSSSTATHPGRTCRRRVTVGVIDTEF